MQSVNFALLNFDNIEKSKDTFDEKMVEPLLTLFKDKFKLDSCFIALVIEDTYELVIGKNSTNKDSEHFVKIYNLGKEGYNRLFKNYDEDLICDHANSVLNGESILHYGVFRDDGTLDGIVGFADFHVKKRVWTKEERNSLVKLGRTLRLAVLYEKMKLQSKQQISRLRNEFKDQINIITAATSDYSSIFLIDYDTLVQTLYYTNGRYKTITDISSRELYYPKCTTLAVYASVYKDDRKRVLEAADINNVKARLAADGIYTINYRRYIEDELDYAAFRYSLIELDNKKYIVLSIKEVSEPKNTKEESNYDELTGLFTKEEFMKRTEEKISLSKDIKNLYMIAFDVDKITKYNAYFGMDNGNILLKHIASILKTLTEKSDAIYCRLSADKFAVLLDEPIEEVEEFIKGIKSNVKLFNPKFYVNLSFGLYHIETRHIPVTAYIDRALSAVKGAKYKYDRLYNLYDATIVNKRSSDKYIIDNLDEVFKNNLIVPYYQPIYDIVNDRIFGIEELARWIAKDRIIEFKEFKEVFVTTRNIFKMDVSIWEESIKFIKYRIQNNLEAYPVYLNICDDFLTYKELPENLNKIIKRYSIPADLVYLEINSEPLIKNYNDIINVIKLLKNIGFNIVLDNFNLDLCLLKDPYYDVIKLNFNECSMDNNSKIILSNIVSLANELNLKIIATKVETKEEFNFAKENNIQYAQGYYFNKALSEKELSKLK